MYKQEHWIPGVAGISAPTKDVEKWKHEDTSHISFYLVCLACAEGRFILESEFGFL